MSLEELSAELEAIREEIAEIRSAVRDVTGKLDLLSALFATSVEEAEPEEEVARVAERKHATTMGRVARVGTPWDNA